MDQRLVGLDFGLPSKTPAQGYLNMHYYLAMQFAGAVLQITTHADPRVRYFIELILATLPDEEKREEAKRRLNEAIDKIMKESKDSMETKQFKVNLECFVMYGHVWSYLDEFIGIERKLKIGEIGEPFKEEEPTEIEEG